MQRTWSPPCLPMNQASIAAERADLGRANAPGTVTISGRWLEPAFHNFPDVRSAPPGVQDLASHCCHLREPAGPYPGARGELAAATHFNPEVLDPGAETNLEQKRIPLSPNRFPIVLRSQRLDEIATDLPSLSLVSVLTSSCRSRWRKPKSQSSAPSLTFGTSLELAWQDMVRSSTYLHRLTGQCLTTWSHGCSIAI